MRMERDKSIYLTGILIFGLLLSCTDERSPEDNYKSFYGVETNERTASGYEELKGPLNNQEKAALAAVLIYYGVPVKFSGGPLSIPETEFNDLNYLYNLTIKSRDSVWMAEHILSDEN